MQFCIHLSANYDNLGKKCLSTMYRQCFCSQKECQKCIFQQFGDLNFKNFLFNAHHELNLWGKTAASKSAWIKAWEHKNIHFLETQNLPCCYLHHIRIWTNNLTITRLLIWSKLTKFNQNMSEKAHLLRKGLIMFNYIKVWLCLSYKLGVWTIQTDKNEAM